MHASLSVSVSLALASTAIALPPLQPKAGEPIPGLTPGQRALFDLGKSAYSRPFTATEGLGPAFNASNCAACHEVPIGGWGSSSVQHFGRLEANGSFNFLEEFGGPVRQRLPLTGPCSEPLPAQANHVRSRVTPSVLAFGLVEALTDAQIAANADPNDANGDGVSGRVHMVRPLEAAAGSPLRAGRFGWKAQIATVLSFSGDAGRTEMGITNRVVPVETAPGGGSAPPAGCDTTADPEEPSPLGLHFVDSITNFQRYLAPPPQTPRAGMAGEVVFNSIGCAKCHVPSFTTPNDPSLESALRNKTFRPYSDFLLHDMGDLLQDGIGDGIPDGDAGRFEMKTPPLWNLRTRPVMLHDGQASGSTLDERIDQSIARHGGEGSNSRAAFNALSAPSKDALRRFLGSLGRDEFDVDGNGTIDRDDYGLLVARGSDANVSPDEDAAAADVNANGAIDAEELAFLVQLLGIDNDCNQNNVADHIEIRAGISRDTNGNGTPDECDALTCGQRIVRRTVPGGPIPDFSIPMIPLEVIIPSSSIPEPGLLDRVSVGLKMTHTWLGDVRATLQRGTDSPKDVVGLACPTCDRLAADLDGLYWFSSTPGLAVPCNAPDSAYLINAADTNCETRGRLLPGNYKVQATTWFGSSALQVQATWKLRFLDPRPNDSGQLESWILDLVYTPSSIVDCNQNGSADSCDIADGLAFDDDHNEVPDSCQIQVNGTLDCNGNQRLDSAETAMGLVADCNQNGRPDSCEPDSDGDGVIDACDQCPTTGLLVAPTVCGCAPATDSDGDGTPNCVDACPNDPAKTSPGACGCGFSDADDDQDGTPNCNDGCPNDSGKTSPGTCGCGISDADTDGDGRKDCQDNCPSVANASQADCNNDGVGDACTAPVDCNGNGVLDVCDIASGNSSDANHDGIPDECVADCNANGIADSTDIANGTATDCNLNGRPDSCDIASGSSSDLNGNGKPDDCPGEWIVGGSGFATIQAAVDAAPTGTIISIAPGTYAPVDLGSKSVSLRALGAAGSAVIDGGGTAPCIKMFNVAGLPPVIDKLKLRNGRAENGGGASIVLSSPIISNCIIENCTATIHGGGIVLNGSSARVCGCTVTGCSAATGGGISVIGFSGANGAQILSCTIQGNAASTSGGGVFSKTGLVMTRNTSFPNCPTTPNQIVGNAAPLGAGVRFDPVGSAQLGATRFCLNAASAIDGPFFDLGGNILGRDCNANNQCDDDEIAAQPSRDCNLNGELDSCEIASGSSPDCNSNGVLDSCDIASGASQDTNADGVPDECSNDCNSNGVLDSVEIANGSVPDCNGNAKPDSCDLALGDSTDLDGNGRLDECSGEFVVGGSGFPTLAAAVDAAPNGGTIRIGPGTFSGALLLTSKHLTIRSTNGPSATILSGTGLDASIIVIRGLATAGTILEGITLRDGPTGTAEFGTRLGGAIFLDTTNVVIRNCRFLNNRTSGIGGAVYAYNSSGLADACLFDGNFAELGSGAMQMGFGGDFAFQNCSFVNNMTNGDGGAVAVVQWFEGPVASSRLTGCTFRGNSAGRSAGALYWYAGVGTDLEITGCVFESNLAPDAAAARTAESGDTSLRFAFAGTRFCLNSVANVSGPMIDLGGNTFSGDCNHNGVCDADEIADGTATDCDANDVLDSCDIAAGLATDCNGNGRPDLCDINLGFSTDLDADGRLDECAGQLVVGGSGFGTIAAAVNAAAPGSTIRVGPGQHQAGLVLSTKPVSLVSIAGPRATILDGTGLDKSILRIRGAATNGTVIDGFTFRDGTIGTAEFDERLGGAIFLHSTNAQIRNCHFTDNQAGYGGAIYAYDSSGSIEHCVFDGNHALSDAGALQVGFGGTMALRDNIFTGNTSDRHGGALQVVYWLEGAVTSCVIENCVFSSNDSQAYGGAISWFAGLGGDLVITGCSIDSNTGTSASCTRLPTSTSASSAFTFADTRFCRNTPGNIQGPYRDLGGNTFSQDCNANGICDADEIASGALADCDHDAIPDTCQVGRVIAWGQNSAGQINVPSNLGSPRAISAGCDHAIAIRANGTVAGWGSNSFGQAAVPSGVGAVLAIAAGCEHNLALRANGTIAAWGRNTYGQTLVPSGANGNVAQLAAGANHSGVRKTDGSLVLWGRNIEGQLNVPASLGPAARLALGGAHTAALRPNGSFVGWGLNSSGQCTAPSTVGVLMEVAAGASHTVALRTNRTVVAWGSNGFGESTVPPGVSGVQAIAVGSGQHTILLMEDGSAFGWGRNDFAQASPASGTEDTRLIAAGGNFSLALTRSASDCDNNSVLDSCELLAGTAADCNHNGSIDTCDIASGVAADCDLDSVPDSCEIASGQSSDINGNGVPDNCESVVGGSGFASIQAAIDSVASGATILVGPGTYTGTPIHFGDKRIKLRSIAGPNATILDGTGLSLPILTIASSLANDSEIVGFTFRNAQRGGPGSTTKGGAISVSGTGQLGFLRLTITSCIFEDNSAGIGGAIYAQQLLGKIEGCDFRNNSASQGGSIFTRRGIWELRNCSINNSTANDGGGLYAESPISGLVFGTTLEQNFASNGSAMFWRQLADTGPMQMTSCTVVRNSGSSGAAIALDGAVPLPLTSSFICLNSPANFLGPVQPDSTTIISGDCNENGICDLDDIANGEPDANGNGVPDACDPNTGDLNGDGVVNAQDITVLLAAWGSSNAVADLNHDGIVGAPDLTILLASWGS